MNELKIQIETTPGGIVVFRLTGPLVLATLFEFQHLAREKAEAAALIDLAGVPYMDSAGLGAILGVMASRQRTGRGFGITCVPDRIRTLFKITHVDGLIPSYHSVEVAESEMVKIATREPTSALRQE